MSTQQPIVTYIEDNEALRYAMSRVLRQEGFAVQEAQTGAEGLRLTRTAPHPDLVLLDVRLPDMSGFEVCRLIKEDPLTASIPVVHMSATHAADDYVVQGLEGGADGYLTEPVDPRVLVATVRAMLRARTAEMQVRAANRRLQQVLAGMTDAYIALDPDGRVLDINATAQGLYGRTASELRARVFWDEFPEAVGGPIHEHVQRVRRDGKPAHFEARSAVVPGRWFDAHVYSNEEGVEIYLRDITDRKRVEMEREELLQREAAARREAEQANALKDQFLAILSHELRTPLNAIVGWTHVLRTSAGDAALRERAVEVIARNSHQQARLIEEILDVSRIVTGKLALDVAPLDWVQVVEGAAESVRPAAEARGLRLEVALGRVPAAAQGDAQRLQQVVFNLLSNAVKFSESGRILLRLDSDGGELRLAVEDEGIGIDSEFLPHVFERFRQADPSPGRTQPGLGLGLTIVRHIVELHGGRVVAHSEGRSHGTRIEVTLPLQPPGAGAGAQRSLAAAAEPADGNVVRGRRVLVVENHADSRALIETVLQGLGAKVTAAATAPEARAALLQEPPDLILCDIGMPGEHGLAFVKWVRSSGARLADIPVVALTAYAADRDRDEGMEAGFDAYVTKPFDPELLVRRLAEAIARRSFR